MFRTTAIASLAAMLATTALGQDLPQADSEYFTEAQTRLQEMIELERNTNPALNVILFIADGMGVATNYGIRVHTGQQQGLLGEEYNLPYDLYPHSALIKTFNINAQTPDSAPTAGSMNTGTRQIFNTINVSETAVFDDCASEERLRLFAEIASDAGRSVGVVSSARITHATGAAVYASTANRNWESTAPEGCVDIATQLIDQMEAGVIDIALGGGARAFAPAGVALETATGNRADDVNLVERAQEAGFQYAYDMDTLSAANLDGSTPLLGLFTASDMNYEHDRPESEPSLADMTRVAIDYLSSNEEGFYLMVEGGRVDHALHAGNAHRAFTDGAIFAEAVALADEMTDDENTLIIVTADHEHVITFGGYCGRGTPITGLCMGIANDQIEHTGEPELADDGLPYTVVNFANGAGSVLIEQEDGTYSGARPELTQEDATDPDYLQQALLPMSSETHSGVDVGLWAKGPWAHLFGGTMDQQIIFHVMNHAAFGAAE